MADNKLTGQLSFLEFTLAMDHPWTLDSALAMKSTQYADAEKAALREQHDLAYSDSSVKDVSTVPFIFGV